jgi:hypothetical protein
LQDFDPVHVGSGSKPAVIKASALGSVNLSHPTLAECASTSRLCHEPTLAPGVAPSIRKAKEPRGFAEGWSDYFKPQEAAWLPNW